MLSQQDINEEVHDNASEILSFEDYVSVVLKHKENPQWCHREIQETYDYFDKDENGGLESVGI